MIPRLKLIGTFFIILSVLVYFGLNMFSYFDPLSMCYIKIEGDILRGEESTIESALKLLKKNTPSEYQNVCKYVSVISEKNCFAGDPRVDKRFETNQPKSCYIRGTEIIYIEPTKDKSKSTVQKRAAMITGLAGLSQEFRFTR